MFKCMYVVCLVKGLCIVNLHSVIHTVTTWFYSLVMLSVFFKVCLMMADSSQTRIFRKVEGQFLHACWWLGDFWCAHPTALWTDKLLGLGWLRCCLLFLPPAFSFAASCLSASNLWLAFLTDECQPSWSGASCCYDWWLIPAYTRCLFSRSL